MNYSRVRRPAYEVFLGISFVLVFLILFFAKDSEAPISISGNPIAIPYLIFRLTLRRVVLFKRLFFRPHFYPTNQTKSNNPYIIGEKHLPGADSQNKVPPTPIPDTVDDFEVPHHSNEIKPENPEEIILDPKKDNDYEKDLENFKDIQTPTPTPIFIQPETYPEEETIDSEGILSRLMGINSKVASHSKRISEITHNLQTKFNISKLEVPIPTYVSRIKSPNETLTRSQDGAMKNFYGYKKNNSLPKNLVNNNVMAWSVNGTTAVFTVIPTKKLDKVFKIIFEGLREDCLINEFYIVTKLNNGVEVAHGKQKLSLGTRQTIYLPYEVEFKSMEIVVLTNHGDSEKVCVGDFEAYKTIKL